MEDDYIGQGAPSYSSTASSRPATAAPGGDGSAEIRRGYDEERQAHFVTGRFRIAHNLHVTVAGAPKISMGTIVVTLSGVTRDSALRQCQGLEVLIHGEPKATERNEAVIHVDRVKIESRFDFNVFQPLAERFPVFGVRACGTTWAFTPHQLEQLRALLAVYSDLAQKLQGDTEPEPVAPGQTAL